MYVSYVHNNNIWVAQLASDAKSEIKSQEVYVPPSNIGALKLVLSNPSLPDSFRSLAPSSGSLKGTRFFKRNGLYYILAADPATSEYVLKAGSVFGTYTIKTLASNLVPPIQGGGRPHRGAIVDSTSWTAGEWYYIALVDAYPGGRIPVIAPITWDSDDFPTLTVRNSNLSPPPALPYHSPAILLLDSLSTAHGVTRTRASLVSGTSLIQRLPTTSQLLSPYGNGTTTRIPPSSLPEAVVSGSTRRRLQTTCMRLAIL